MIELRDFDRDDLDRVHELIQGTIDACYEGVYPPRAVRFFKELHSRDGIVDRMERGDVVVAVLDGRLVATGSLVGHEIGGVFVDPASQRQGVGRALMDELEARARQHGFGETELSVSLPSRGFYERLAYRDFEERSLDLGEGQVLDYWQAWKTL